MPHRKVTRLDEWPVWSKVEKDNVEMVGHAFERGQNHRQVLSRYGIVFQNGHDVGPVLHHVLKNLPLADPVGHRAHVDITPVTTRTSPIHKCLVVLRKILAVNSPVNDKVQIQGPKMRYDLPTPVIRPIQIDDRDLHDSPLPTIGPARTETAAEQMFAWQNSYSSLALR